VFLCAFSNALDAVLTKLAHSKLVLSDLNLQFEEVDDSDPFELKKKFKLVLKILNVFFTRVFNLHFFSHFCWYGIMFFRLFMLLMLFTTN